ncbi:hypothetical protein EYF80_037020 [Liparis tanakae]|uniref:Uncharacterized protein n=1 Tax=Liparis tanakae TaxID=230148 RepID=A0A4Z2GGX0_9TELE|nr:hypothetical protein EYF80_037020 [Liparis tanakae]
MKAKRSRRENPGNKAAAEGGRSAPPESGRKPELFCFLSAAPREWNSSLAGIQPGTPNMYEAGLRGSGPDGPFFPSASMETKLCENAAPSSARPPRRIRCHFGCRGDWKRAPERTEGSLGFTFGKTCDSHFGLQHDKTDRMRRRSLKNKRATFNLLLSRLHPAARLEPASQLSTVRRYITRLHHNPPPPPPPEPLRSLSPPRHRHPPAEEMARGQSCVPRFRDTNGRTRTPSFSSENRLLRESETVLEPYRPTQFPTADAAYRSARPSGGAPAETCRQERETASDGSRHISFVTGACFTFNVCERSNLLDQVGV